MRLTDTGGGIGDKVVWRVDGVTQGGLRSRNRRQQGARRLPHRVADLAVDPSRRNVIEITAYNGTGLLAS